LIEIEFSFPDIRDDKASTVAIVKENKSITPVSMTIQLSSYDIQFDFDGIDQSKYVYYVFNNELRPFLTRNLSLNKSLTRFVAKGVFSVEKKQKITRKLVSILGDEWESVFNKFE
jgi:hypothetical protein